MELEQAKHVLGWEDGSIDLMAQSDSTPKRIHTIPLVRRALLPRRRRRSGSRGGACRVRYTGRASISIFCIRIVGPTTYVTSLNLAFVAGPP